MGIINQIEDILVDINCHFLYNYPLDIYKINSTFNLLEVEFKKELNLKHRPFFMYFLNKVHSSFQLDSITDVEIHELKQLFVLLSHSYNGISNIKKNDSSNFAEIEVLRLKEENYFIEIIRIFEYLNIFKNKSLQTLEYVNTLSATSVNLVELENRLEYYAHFYYLIVEDYKEILDTYEEIILDKLSEAILKRVEQINILINEIEAINKNIFKIQMDLDVEVGRREYMEKSHDSDDSNVVDGEAEFWREWYHGDIDRLGF